MKINEIFNSLDGECNGFRGAGQPTVFIRLQGCNLPVCCEYCDTKYAQEVTGGWKVGIEEVLGKVNRHKVTITGGEPLLQAESVRELVGRLVPAHDVTIETNGSLQIPRDFVAPHLRIQHVRFVVDYKLGAQEEFMCEPLFAGLPEWDIIKFVVKDLIDYRYAKQLARRWRAQKVVSPVIPADGDLTWARRLATAVIEDGELQYSLQIQKILEIK